MFISKILRATYGQYRPVTDRYMIHAGVEQTGICQACGHKIKDHKGVISPDGFLYWVGVECLDILTDDNKQVLDITEGTTWNNNGHEYIKPTQEWINQLSSKTFKQVGRYVEPVNPFLASIWQQVTTQGQVSIKQYESVNKTLTA